MNLFDRIVVGVDGTLYGTEALQQALVLAPSGAAVHAVTALDTSIAVHAGFNVSHITEQLEEEAGRARDRAQDLIGERANCTARIVRGHAGSALQSVSSEVEATLLVVRGRSSSRMLGLMVGETASTLLHEGQRSTLLARPRSSDSRWSPDRVVVGIDGSPYSLAALAAADDLAERLGSTVEVVAATGGKPVDSSGEWAERVNTWDSGRPVDVLQRCAENADLVLLGSRGVHGVKALGSVSERVAHHTACSALVVHTPPPA